MNEMNLNNLIFTLDAYKWDHESLYPDGFENSYSYMTCRSDETHKESVFFGLQYILQRWLVPVVTQSMLNEAKMIALHAFGDESCINSASWQRIIDEMDGKLPLLIKAIPEGTRTKKLTCLMTVEATVEGFGWLASAMETVLQQNWYMMQASTRVYEIVKGIKERMAETSDNEFLGEYMLVDFSQRGVSCMEQAGIGSMSALLSTTSSDAMMGIPYAVNFYKADVAKLLKSVRATEHAVSTPYGDGRGELEYFRNILRKHKNGVISFVSDTNGIVQFVEEKLPQLKEEILDHWKNGNHQVNKTVIRPDSKRFEGDTPALQCLWLVESLAKTFGYSTNSKKYKVLHPAIGAIYGDGLSQEDIREIYVLLKANGWSAENILVGMGGGLLQRDFHRDILATAFKASCQKFNGVWRDIKKKTTEVFKRSLSGKFSTVLRDGEYVSIPQLEEGDPERDYLEDVYKDGELLRFQTYEEIKDIVWDRK